MGNTILGLGMLGVIGCIIWIVQNKKRGTPNRPALTGLAVSAVLIIVGVAISPPTEPETTDSKETTIAETTISETTTAHTTVETTTELDMSAPPEEKLEAIAEMHLERSTSLSKTQITPPDIAAIWVKFDNVLSEDYLVQSASDYMVVIMEDVFEKIPELNSVALFAQVSMIDAKGNTEDDEVVKIIFTRENAAEINYERFSSMVGADYNTLLKIADETYIHPGIYKKLKKVDSSIWE